MLLAVLMIFSLLPFGAFAAETDGADSGNVTVVIAGSDFQDPDGDTGSSANVSAILEQIYEDHPTADGFLFAGDYHYNMITTSSDETTHINALKSTVEGVYGADIAEVFVQGNHDQVAQGSCGLAGPGAHDTDTYGVFVIDEDDYQWGSGVNEARIKQTAQNLTEYLNAKIAVGCTAPIFVVSHVPLHFTSRTSQGDGKYASYIFDVLNAAGAAGLNIIFMYGHDHSNGWDNYLGGAAVYLPEGSDINIAQTGSGSKFDTKELNFTYMNAGFTGYYADREASNNNTSGVDDALTMSVFTITDDSVTVQRYDANGQHTNLKSIGKTNVAHGDNGCAVTTNTIPSPQTISLTGAVDTSVRLPDVIPQTNPDPGQSEGGTKTYTRVTSASELEDGGKYLIIYNGSTDAFMLPKDSGYTDRIGMAIESTSVAGPDTITGAYGAKEWTFTKSGTRWLIGNGTNNLTLTQNKNSSSSYDAKLSGAGTAFTVGGSANNFTFADASSSGHCLNKNSTRDLINGYNSTSDAAKFYIYKQTSAAPEDDYPDSFDWTRVTEDIPGATTYKYVLDTNGVDLGSKYLIVAPSNPVALNGTTKQNVTISADGNTITTTTNAYEWLIDTESNYTSETVNYSSYGNYSSYEDGDDYYNDNGTYYKVTGISWPRKPNGNKYNYTCTITCEGGKTFTKTQNNVKTNVSPTAITLYKQSGITYIRQNGKYLTNSSSSVTNSTTPVNFTFTGHNNGTYTLYNGSRYLRYSSSNFNFNNYNLTSTSNIVRLYKYDSAETAPGTPGEWAKMDPCSLTVIPGTTSAELDSQLRANIVAYKNTTGSGTGTRIDNSQLSFDFAGFDGSVPGIYEIPVKYKNMQIGYARVEVLADMPIASAELIDNTGTVYVGATKNAKTGAYIHVTFADGRQTNVPVTVGMLLNNMGNSVSTASPAVLSGLTVKYGNYYLPNFTLNVVEREQSDYPEFPNEGSVRVNKTGSAIDFENTGVAKVELSATGVPLNKGVDVIVMLDTSSSMNETVSGYSYSRLDALRNAMTNMLTNFKQPNADGSQRDLRIAIADFNGYTYLNQSTDNTDTVGTNGGARNNANNGKVYTGSGSIDKNAFVNVNTLNFNVNSIQTASGTNYDYAFETVYDLAAAIKAENEANQESRELVVIFMSDGAPFQYNYFWANSDNAEWNNWLKGTYAQDAVPGSSAHKNFYNGPGNPHRVAEAIKGDPETDYDVIKVVNNGYEMQTVKGLDAQLYTIGFCLADDKQIKVASMEHVLKNIATTEDDYFKAENQAELTAAFDRIAGSIKYAATDAYFLDTMGANYKLQLANTYTANGITYNLRDKIGTAPQITVTEYDIYKKSDIGHGVNGVTVTKEMVGKRTGTSKVLETVTFNEDGTLAYSDKIGTTTNILIDGVINAKTFWYNTKNTAVMIDTNGDGTAETSLAPETFYWKLGTINESELALSYYVYLEGSMEGTRPAGSYPTNESAVLYYTNYLDHAAHKDTVSPKMPWKAAHVNYAFYLVDQNGDVIVNKDSGETGSFANKVALTNPTMYGEIMLNSGTDVNAMTIVAAENLPDGYTLYDPSASYKINISSGDEGSWWNITKGQSKETTYVTDYNGNEFTTTTYEDDQSYDYTHTTVWFAVKYESKPINDVIVIDYGIPVNASVLGNDMLPSTAIINAISPSASFNASRTYTGNYGTVSITKDNKQICYTPNCMTMKTPEVIYYSVMVDNAEKYATLTVIPATKVYYEDNFVSFTNSKAVSGNMGAWTTDGTVVNNATQAEDRPGDVSLQSIDANNIYGYDGAYTNYTKFSLGSAHKVTVDAATGSGSTAPEANFTFTGTGFDIISVTDNISGSIRVTVKQNGARVKVLTVNNFYGYDYTVGDDGKGVWTPAVGDGSNALYQVPVIKVEGLAYGTYDVTIQVAYLKSADVRGLETATFWLDAIRVYDPAKNDNTAKEAYALDKESTPDYTEIRNLIIEADNFYIGKKDDDKTVGIVFIDGIPLNSVLGDYEKTGPNNETYLNNGQAIAIQFIANSRPDSVQIGAKLANGESATLFYNGKEFRTLTTATDMYYELAGLSWTDNGDRTYTSDIIILQNASDSRGVISLTNIKITGGAEFIVTSDDPVNEVMSFETPAVTAIVSPLMANRALAMINAYSAPVEYVYPEILSVDVDDNDVRVGETVTATIIASADTDFVIVNGVTLDTFTVNEDGNTVWTYSYTAEDAGEVQLVVTAENINGTASADYVYTFSASEPDPEPEKESVWNKLVNGVKSVFDKLFGWLKK